MIRVKPQPFSSFSLHIFIVLWTLAGAAFAGEAEQIEKEKPLCETGNLGACLRVAEYLSKHGPLAKAIIWYERPCKAGDETSCLKLGSFYKAQPNPKQALYWYRNACLTPASKGEGCYEVAQLARDNKSEKNASHWLSKACAQGFKKSCS